jgi:hypothetical protein
MKGKDKEPIIFYRNLVRIATSLVYLICLDKVPLLYQAFEFCGLISIALP